jgi:hypothetical protein
MELSQIIMLLIGISLIIYYILILRYTFINKQIGDPWLIETTHSLQNPKTIRSELIRRSNDSKYGVEFTYTFWIYIEKWPETMGVLGENNHTHILHKGENSDDPILQAPGVWLKNDINTMSINMNSLKNFNNYIDIPNFPVKKWVHVSIMLINSNFDVFINGKLKKRKQFTNGDKISPPKENYGNLYISNSNSGIRGYISRLRYFNSAIPFWRIEQMVKDKPSRAACPITNLKPPKLSDDWWS